MKRIVIFISCILIILSAGAKKKIKPNSGGTKQKNYYSVMPYESMWGTLAIIKVEVGGKERRFLLDTGAVTSISQELADELKPKVTETNILRDAEGYSEEIITCIIPEIKVGGVLFKKIPAAVIKKAPFTYCHELDGIIGSNLLRNSIVRFSHNDKTITLTDQPKKLDLHKKKELSSKIFLTPDQSSPYIKTFILDSLNADVELMFDSGMTGFFDMALRHFHLFNEHQIFSDSIWEASGSNTHGAFGKTQDTIKYSFSVKKFVLNEYIFNNLRINTTASNNSRIGMGFLEYGDITLDYKNKRFYFEPYSDEGPDLSYTPNSFSFNVAGDKLVVGLIWNPEMESRINVGDQIISINGIRFDEMSECELLLYDMDKVLSEGIKEDQKEGTIEVKKQDTGEIVKLPIHYTKHKEKEV